MSNNFAIIGVAGYIAPRHLKAIKEVNGNLVAAYDIADAVGILDTYFPACDFFTNETSFFKFLAQQQTLDYLVICSPNYLHEAHCLAGLQLATTIICEKPLSLTVDSLHTLKAAQQQSGKQIFTILQLRLLPMLIQLKKEMEQSTTNKFEVNIEYYTPRGKWYHQSWKGDIEKSGGIATNIGIHLFDLVTWLFGNCKQLHVEKNTKTTSIGTLHLDKASIHWNLSIDSNLRAKRQMSINGKVYEFTEGFSDLHTQAYREIIKGNGFTIDNIFPSVAIVEQIRKSIPSA